MKLIIDITKEDYNRIKDMPDAFNSLTSRAYKSIKNGTPLLKSRGRIFEKLVVEYPSEDTCTYPEYKGKPYFGIEYIENGEHIIGYGTYKPTVLSQYIKDYFIKADREVENDNN